MSDDEIRQIVKTWLHTQNRKSYQLAEEVGIKPQTFYAQMSVRKISTNTKRALAQVVPEITFEEDFSDSSISERNDPVRLKIRSWLKHHGKTRQWLAEQCKVSVRTVHTWFTARGSVPVTQSLFIAELMKESASNTGFSIKMIPVSFSETEICIIQKFQERHPSIDLNMYGMHKILEFCVNTLTQDEQDRPALQGSYASAKQDM